MIGNGGHLQECGFCRAVVFHRFGVSLLVAGAVDVDLATALGRAKDVGQWAYPSLRALLSARRGLFADLVDVWQRCWNV